MLHNMEQIKISWSRIKERLINETNFMEFLSGRKGFYEWLYEERDNLPKEIWTSYGTTRAVFGEHDSNVVFKVLKHRNDINYSASEEFIYHKAQEYGVDKWFAWTSLVEEINVNGVKTPIYAMDYCEVDSDGLEEASYQMAVSDYCDEMGKSFDELTDDEKEEVYSWVDEDDIGGSDSMRNYMYENYDHNDMDELFEFLDRFNVNDTHCGNWGYLNNRLVLIDFGGFDLDLVAMAEGVA